MVFLLSSDVCGGIGPIVGVIKGGVFPIIQIGIPILLILMGSIDLGKAVIASDEKEVKAAQGRLIKRFIYAILVFFIPTLVFAIMDIVSNSADENSLNDNDWRTCWNCVRNGDCK